MKIDNLINKTSTTGVRSKQGGPTTGAEKADSGVTASVNVSSQLPALSAMAGSANVFDAGKVEEIKSAIANGQFQVDTEKVADNLIGTTRELIQAAKAKA